MLTGILFISFSIIAFFTVCLCRIIKKEMPKPNQNPEQINVHLGSQQREVPPANQMESYASSAS
jgi:hypothetical protein